LNKMQSPNTRDKVFVTLHQRHLLRWEKQLAMRGNARNLTEDGICGHQKLFVTSEFKRFVQFRDMLFPDAVFSVDGSTRRAATQKGGSRAVAAFLMTQDGDSFTSVVLAEATGALPNHLRRILSSSIVVRRSNEEMRMVIHPRTRPHAEPLRPQTTSDTGGVSAMSQPTEGFVTGIRANSTKS
jgi:hypothetical protein